MARKKRRTFQQELPKEEEKPTKAYRDDFQSTVGNRLEDMSKKVEGKGKNIIYALAALGVLILAVGIYYVYSQRQAAKAQTALGKAIETSQAQIRESPDPTNPNAKTFKTEQERANASIAAFQNVIDKFDGEVEQKAKYFIAVNKMQIDRPAAINELTELANSGGEVGTLSKFALAQAKTDDGKLDEAAALYAELAAVSNPILAKDTINFELAKIYEKQGKTAEAADLYYNIAKPASEAKDLEDKPIPMSQTARDARQKLETLNPEKAKEIKADEPAAAPGGAPLQVNTGSQNKTLTF